jgi:hypothetical protein
MKQSWQKELLKLEITPKGLSYPRRRVSRRQKSLDSRLPAGWQVCTGMTQTTQIEETTFKTGSSQG